MVITGRNEVVAKVIFLHLFVILFTGVGCDGIPEGTEADPLPGAEPPWSRHPPLNRPPWEADTGIRSTSGRYASYWNAFFFNHLFVSLRSFLNVVASRLWSHSVWERAFRYPRGGSVCRGGCLHDTRMWKHYLPTTTVACGNNNCVPCM